MRLPLLSCQTFVPLHQSVRKSFIACTEVPFRALAQCDKLLFNRILIGKHWQQHGTPVSVSVLNCAADAFNL